ncbi:hypothetical protein [Flagellimonas sp. S3867]|uniref:hypothetical protein n=1 Tax=Flagellimonas sp. S3867 TaxID=2768063 RepID=UPI00168403C6|nr:hypothetical protein [Flagellimonas sp. S3867]
MKMFIYILLILTTVWNSENHVATVENDKFPLIGIWISEDNQTRGITKCNIQYKNGHFIVHVWASCSPQDCDWGEKASDQEKNDIEKFNFIWDHEFAERDMVFELIAGKLKITTTTSFKDNSDRPTRTKVEYFVKQTDRL